MAWWDDDENYSFDDSAWGETNWNEEGNMPYRENYEADFYQPEEFNLPDWTQQSWRPQSEPQFNFKTPPIPEPVPMGPPQQEQMGLSRYDDMASNYPQPAPLPSDDPNQSWVSAATGAITRGAKGVGNWALENPKDAFGMAAGAGMGLYGLLQPEGKVPKPDMGPLNAARAALEAQAAKTSRINDPLYEESVAAMRGEIGKAGGNYDPRLVEARKQERAAIEGRYQSRGTFGSDIANRELADFDRQTTSLLEDDSTRRSQLRMGNYQIGANTGNPQQTTNIFSRLADTGVQGAQLQQQAGSTNAQLAEQRRNSLLSAGGNIFGRSIATNPMEGEYDPRTGKKRTTFGA